jgi:hypothetical protein
MTTNKKYNEFLKQKEIKHKPSGFDIDVKTINDSLFDWQKEIVKMSVKSGKSAIFADCGLGKTLMQLEWSKLIGGKNLILSPLAVSEQTKTEGVKFGYDVNICESKADVTTGINITNYEKLHKFDCSVFDSIVLDESSILKNYSGSTRNQIIQSFFHTPYKLCCTATPSPNDFTEIGNHSEFLNVMTRTEMLSMFFINDTSDTGTWRIKGHAKDNIFWKWLSSWAMVLRKPSDIGFSDNGFELPPLNILEEIIPFTGYEYSFVCEYAKTLNERRQARNESLFDRVKRSADLCNTSKDQWIVWCNLNDESKALASNINESVEITGSNSDDHKKKTMLDFIHGKIKVIVTKPSIAGFGMNFQNCHNMAFVGLSDSFEQYYQAVRRCWRFGQTKEVNAYIITGEKEGAVVDNIKRKESDMSVMFQNMIVHMKEFNCYKKRGVSEYKPSKTMGMPSWM